MILFLTNKEIVELNYAISQINKNEKNHRLFTYAITLTEEYIKPHLKAIQKASVVSEEFRAYLEKREKLIMDNADKDETGNLIYNNYDETIKIKDEQVSFLKSEFVKLDGEYAGAIAERKSQDEELEALMNKEVEVEIEQVEIEYFPEYINVMSMRALKPLVKRK